MKKLSLILAALAATTACDFSGDFMFSPPFEDVPGVVHLGELEPIEYLDRDTLDENVLYAEIGPSDSVALGGATFTFVGTSSPVCVWVDPELVYWTQSVSPTSPVAKWTYPDNVFDDGDIDLYAGLSVFYSGAPGEKLGNFVQKVEDDLGHTIEASLSVCNIPGYQNEPNGHAGRASPEYCTIKNTLPGVSYTVVLQGFSLPLDDDRLSFGVILADGTCDNLKETFHVGNSLYKEECLIVGEAVVPDNAQGSAAKDAGYPSPSWLGLEEVPSWPGSTDFEESFCAAQESMSDFCETEAEFNLQEGIRCDWTGGSQGQHCFCGNPADTPTGGAF